MTTNDGATSARKRLAQQSNVSDATAAAMTGADLEYARLARQSGLTPHDGNRLEQAAASNPRIGSLTVVTGAAAGGTATTLIGTGFKDATSVTFDGVAGTSFAVVDDNRINVTSPAGSAGTADVAVVTPDGTDTNLAAWTYT